MSEVNIEIKVRQMSDERWYGTLGVGAQSRDVPYEEYAIEAYGFDQAVSSLVDKMVKGGLYQHFVENEQ